MNKSISVKFSVLSETQQIVVVGTGKPSANRTLDIFIFAAGFGCLRVQELSTDKLLALDDCVSKGQSGAGRGRVGAHSLNSKLVLDLFHVLRAADASRVDNRSVVR